MRQDPDTRAAERDALGQYLDYQRETILLKTEGLTKDQLAQKIPTSDLTLAGLLYHLALVEESWLENRFLGMPDRQDWVDVDWVADPDWEFRTATAMDPGTLRQRYRDACERSRQAAASAASLDQLSAFKGNDTEVSHRFSARRMERLVQHLARTRGDADYFVSEAFGWRGGVVLAWSGMRGVITVAAAQSLPDDTPFRPEVVLIAFVVAGTTLLAQGLTLPRVIRALKIPGDDAAADQAEYADLLAELATQAEEVLADPGLSRPGGRPYDGDVLDRVREAALARASLAEAAEPDTVSPREQYRHLMLRILAAERAELLAARAAGRYRSRTLSRAQRALDLMEATLQQIPDLADTES